MSHYNIKTAVQRETGRASTLLVATLMGGVLIVSSFVAEYAFPAGLRDASGRERGSRGRVHDAREATMSRSAAAGALRVHP